MQEQEHVAQLIRFLGQQAMQDEALDWLASRACNGYVEATPIGSDLVLLPFTAGRCETTGRVRLINEVQCCGRVAVQLLYKGNDENISSSLYPYLRYRGCDFTHFFAASDLITLPQNSSFEREVTYEKWAILLP